MRISHPDSGLLAIDRDAEYHNSLAAARCGVGAPVIEYRPELNTLVVGFLEAETCSRADLDDPDRLERVVSACRKLHGGPRFVNELDMFRLQAHYLAVIHGTGVQASRPLPGLPPGPRQDPSRARRDGAGDGPMSQRSPCGELPRRRRPGMVDRLRVRGEQRPLLRAGQSLERVGPQSRSSRSHRDFVLRRPRPPEEGPDTPSGTRVEVRVDAVGGRSRTRPPRSTSTSGRGAWRSTTGAVTEFTSPAFSSLLDGAAGR